MAVLSLEGVRKSFGQTDVLKGIDLTLADGEMLVIVGASGCGKSTLLRLVAGLETVSSGRIVLDGRDIAQVDPSQRDIAMVFQNYALYPHMSVFDNMAYGLRIRGLTKDAIQARVAEAAALLGLDQLLARKPRQLSGGQRQRVAMGRAIVRDPKLFLFDEPLSNLDAKLRVQMRAEIRRLQRRLHVTSLYVTHDQVEAMTLGDRLLILHLGVPVQLATPMEVFERPANTYVASFIGTPSMNLLPATLTRGGAAVALNGTEIALSGMRVGMPSGGSDGMPVTLGIRPEHVVIDPEGAGPQEAEPLGMELRIELVEPLGSETLVHGRLADGEPVTVKLYGPAPAGETMRVSFMPGQLHFFDRTSGLRLATSGFAAPGIATTGPAMPGQTTAAASAE